MTSPVIEKENVAPVEVINTSVTEKKPAAKGAKTKKAKEVKAKKKKKSVSTHPTSFDFLNGVFELLLNVKP
ncbi:hypothetical protein Bca4012_097169 [Brassica carinata]